MPPFVNIKKKQKAKSEEARSQKESQNIGGSRVRHTYTREGGIRKTSAYVSCKPISVKLLYFCFYSYVAATRGSVHVVPGNVPIVSQHLNLAPAPGTF